MIALGPNSGPATFDLRPRCVVRYQLRVNVELTDSTRDQLRVLASEIEYDDGVGLGHGRGIRQRSIGRRRLEGGLEIGLDLGVVGGEHTMAGIRRVAVNGLAPLRPSLLLVRLAQSSSRSGPRSGQSSPAWRRSSSIELELGQKESGALEGEAPLEGHPEGGGVEELQAPVVFGCSSVVGAHDRAAMFSIWLRAPGRRA